MSFVTSFVGGSPDGLVIVGFVDVSLETLMLARRNGLPVVDGEVAVVAVSVAALAGIAGSRAASPPPSSPQAPSPSAPTASSAITRRRIASADLQQIDD